MEKNNPLLPFAFSTSYGNEKISLNTAPREKHVIDENASSMYHTRNSTKTQRHERPVLQFIPSMKRKMGESFNEKDDVKRIEFDNDFFHDPELNASQESDREVEKTRPFHSDVIPSSPPILPQMSEYDHSTSAYTIPDSPIDPDCTIRDLDTSPVKPTRPKFGPSNQSSEADFGIDQFNRFKTLSYIQCPSTDVDIEEVQSNYEKQQNARAREIILKAFDDVSVAVSLEGMDLTEIPEEVEDLNSLVIFDEHRAISTLYQLYFSNNRLRSLNPALFKFEKLNVLSLRQNKLRHIPGAIGKLKNLVDLSISINHLRYLPAQILELPKLTTFSAGPNPFVQVDEDAIEIGQEAQFEALESPSHQCKLNFVSQIKYLQSEKNVPSLKALCLDTIARYDVTYRETKAWKKTTPRTLHLLMAAAVHKGKYEDVCNECDIVVIEPYSEVFEWWNILGNKNIPFKREFCSGKCVSKYKSRMKLQYKI